MTKILYALNHRTSEEQIARELGPDYITVGAVTYREAILNALPGSGADILIFRDTLSGTKDIREFPQKSSC